MYWRQKTAAPWDGLIASHFIAHADHHSLAWIPWIVSRLVGHRQRALLGSWARASDQKHFP
jgi:hypothetical protein